MQIKNIKKNLLEKLCDDDEDSGSKRNISNVKSKKRFLVQAKEEKKEFSEGRSMPSLPSSNNVKNHINCVERRVYQEIEYKLIEQMKLNKELIDRIKYMERPLMDSFDFIIDFYEDLLTLPEFFLSDQKKNFSNFSFDNDTQSMSKNEYLKNMALNFLEINRKILVEFSYEKKLFKIIESYNKQQNKIKESQILKNSDFENSNKFTNKINIFKESLTSSFIGSIKESTLQDNLSNNIVSKSNDFNNSLANLLKENEKNDLYRTKYKWKGELDRDLSFNKGDIIQVYERDSNGWFFGCNLTTGLKGCLPSTYLEPINF